MPLGIVQLFVRIYKFRWVALRKLDIRILGREIIRTPKNPMIIVRCTDFLGREYSDLGVCKFVQIIGRSLIFLSHGAQMPLRRYTQTHTHNQIMSELLNVTQVTDA